MTPIPDTIAPDPKPKGKRGGYRANAGRKLTAATEAAIKLEQAVDLKLEGFALDLVANLKRLADGGYQRVTVTEELATSVYRDVPAGLVMRQEALLDEAGRPRLDADGRPITVPVPAYPNARPADCVSVPVFPDALPGEMVVTRRVIEVADADRAANQYLLDRRLGKPKQAVELSGPDGGAIPLTMDQAIDKIYGEVETTADLSE